MTTEQKQTQSYGDLARRYVGAVIRHLKPAVRQDIAKELDQLIADMLEDRVGEGQPTRADMLAVLEQLGDPEQLAVKYSDSSGLIEGIYFVKYKQVLRILLPIICGIYFSFSFIFAFFDDVEVNAKFVFSTLIGNSLAVSFHALAVAFSAITLVFFALSRKNMLKNSVFDQKAIEALPDFDQSKLIQPYEPIIAIVVNIILATVMLFPNIKLFYTAEHGWQSLFNWDLLSIFAPLVVLIAFACIARELFALVEGRYTMRLCLVTLGCNLLTTALYAVILLNPSILSPQFVTYLGSVGSDYAIALQHINIIIFCFVALVAVGEAVASWIRAR